MLSAGAAAAAAAPARTIKRENHIMPYAIETQAGQELNLSRCEKKYLRTASLKAFKRAAHKAARASAKDEVLSLLESPVYGDEWTPVEGISFETDVPTPSALVNALLAVDEVIWADAQPRAYVNGSFIY
jgi:hypothetical protein|tara:strand:+ start:264 stop:650 length:387 start_codon:yes stop_codon:yes gene_type:complete